MKKYIIHLLPASQFEAEFTAIYARSVEAAIKTVENNNSTVLDIIENSLFTPQKTSKTNYLKN